VKNLCDSYRQRHGAACPSHKTLFSDRACQPV